MTLQQQIILQAIERKIKTKADFDRLKQAVSSKSGKSQPSNQSLLKVYRKMGTAAWPPLEKILKTREIRTLSGVAVITVLTKPWPCPGVCIYCPNDPKMPKSYLPDEPAAARALSLKFNPYTQVKKRIEMLALNGHDTDKIELIVKGGTWSAYPRKYQDWFIRRCFEAANSITPPSPSYLKRGYNKTPPPLKVRGGREGLCQAQKINETAKNRVVGLTLETRPDFITPGEIKHLRELGCTRVELGVQTIDDKILKLVQRGHTAEQTAQATKLLRNAGFKVDYHLMPGLPGSASRRIAPKKDLENFKKIFSDPRFRPDMIKIYPCSIIPGTALYKLWKQGKYKPLAAGKFLDLIIKMKLAVPPYVRISRVIRDIPGTNIAAGNKVTSLRQNIQAEMKRRGLKCNCIRCREVGHQSPSSILPLGKGEEGGGKLQITKYKASNGTEYFLSIEDKKRHILFAFCRLRLPSPSSILPLGKGEEGGGIFPELRGAALIRELHTYGRLVPIDEKNTGDSQHFGFGKKLIQEAERIAKKSGYKKVAVIAGVGVREYYKKLGYGQDETYMIKKL